MCGNSEEDPPGGPAHRIVRDHGETVGQDKAHHGSQRPKNDMDSQGSFRKPASHRRKNSQHISARCEQRHATDHGYQQQREQKHKWPIPPSDGDDLIQPRIDARKPLADRRELLPAHMKPVEQCGGEGLPAALHDDGEHRHHGRAHAQAQGKKNALVPLTLPVAVLLEMPTHPLRFLPDLFGNVLTYPLPLVVKTFAFIPNYGFVGFKNRLATEDTVTAFFLFYARAFSPLGFFEQPGRLVDFGELPPERLIRRQELPIR